MPRRFSRHRESVTALFLLLRGHGGDAHFYTPSWVVSRLMPGYRLCGTQIPQPPSPPRIQACRPDGSPRGASQSSGLLEPRCRTLAEDGN